MTVRGVGARLRARRPVDPETGLPRGVRRGYGVLASTVLGVLLLAVVGALMGPGWEPAPVTDPIEVATSSTAVTGAPALKHYDTRSTIVTVQLDGVTVEARITVPVNAPQPMPGVVFVQLDFLDPTAPEKLRSMIGGRANVVLSDMAANATGHKRTDHLRTMALVEAAAEFAREILAPGGVFLAKELAW